MSKFRNALACASVILFASIAVADGPAAVLMAMQGKVMVHRPQSGELQGTFGMHLGGGDEIVTSADGAADIFFASGQSIHLGADSRITIQGAPAGGNSASFDGVRSFMQLRESRGTSSVARLRSGGGARDVRGLSPSATKLVEARPEFRWSCEAADMDWTLRVYDEQGEIWSGEVKGQQFRYPDDAPALTPGANYSWLVESNDPLQIPPLRSSALVFSCMDDGERKALQDEMDALPEAELSASARAILEASVFYRHGLLDDAIERMERDGAQADDAARAILAQLYVEAGRVEDALIQLDQLAHPN